MAIGRNRYRSGVTTSRAAAALAARQRTPEWNTAPLFRPPASTCQTDRRRADQPYGQEPEQAIEAAGREIPAPGPWRS
jgi:hypothetical protein